MLLEWGRGRPCPPHGQGDTPRAGDPVVPEQLPEPARQTQPGRKLPPFFNLFIY